MADEGAAQGGARGRKRKFKSAGGKSGAELFAERARKMGRSTLSDLKQGGCGFLVTFDQLQARKAQAQMRDWLTEHIEAMRGGAKAAESTGDLAKDLAAEVAKAKSDNGPLQIVETGGCKGCVVFRLRKEYHVDVVEVVRNVFKEVRESGKLRCPSAFSLCPLQLCMFSSAEDIGKRGGDLLRAHFGREEALQETFAIQVRKRMIPSLKRADVIAAVADVLNGLRPDKDAPQPKADLANPDTVVQVEAIKNMAALSVLPRFGDFSKLNLQLAAGITPDDNDGGEAPAALAASKVDKQEEQDK